ncbi:SIS domain-containing protein [Pseudohongiella sp.]|uniref:SIS domain-containing protein n=1 Tax=marine sediment metagenome TaxID=412755 RepID=A0A0F9YLC7_9ZZZZ|nr:SIS domain-containing protein [Pseudohongiella sp.]HDZ10431.1 SIS domain-containing protein [Pseudohongiella sp.]HEA62232.1 SIS domain-containing protein [Pseudohongiella sp.]
MEPQQRVQQHIQHNIATLRETVGSQADVLCAAANRMATALVQGGKILVCGNGGSAALAQYLSALFINRFDRERPGLPALALSADAVCLSTIATDQQYKTGYAQQIRALAQPADILFVMAAGKSSANLREAITAAYDRDIAVILLSSEESSNLAEMLQADDIEIRVPARVTYRSQEIHLVLLHCLCDLIDIEIFGEEL